MTNSYMITCFIACATLSVASASTSGLRSGSQAQASEEMKRKHSLLVQAPQASTQELVICNAYASQHALEILQVRTRQSLTLGTPLAYKECKDFSIPLEDGDQLDFKAGTLDIGSFYATGLPKTASSLLLIPHRRSPHAVGVSFESHAFSQSQIPQIAVIDAYKGKSSKQEVLKITEKLATADSKDSKDATPVQEDLKFNSIVAVNPGQYEISLDSTVAAVALSASGSTKYVVMRLGVEDEGKNGGHYPQELVVFPKNSAPHFVMSMSVTLLMLAAAFHSV